MHLLILLLPMLLINAPLVMQAVRTSCHLFVFSVMPGLFPYLTLVLMLLSRLPAGKPEWLVLLLGWCGGSPAGARLLRQCPQMSAAKSRRLAAACATMSPMFLLGTVPGWLQCGRAGACILPAVLIGALPAAMLANIWLPKDRQPIEQTIVEETHPITFGEAVESSVRTMLLICGVMAMLRAAAELCVYYLGAYPTLCLTLQTLLEVTCGIEQLAALPIALPLRIALISGAAGFGGAALLLQNRTVLPAGLLTFGRQLTLQAVHGVCSLVIGFVLAQLV